MKPTIIPQINFEDVWQEGMKNWEGQLPERMISDEAEESFWSTFMHKKKESNDFDLFAAQFFHRISQFISGEDHVLEIGPGWGNYTFPMLQQVQSLTVVDSSIAVLEYLVEKSQEYDKNLLTVHEKWENFHGNRLYDIVLGINCFYRMFEIKQALININNHASKRCLIGMTTGPLQPHYLDLENQYGYNIKHPRRDYIHLLNLLYELGIRADCELVPLKREYTFDSYPELIKKCSSKLLHQNFQEADISKCIDPYISFKEGKYHYPHHFHGAIITWKPVKFNPMKTK
ncbi:methyltransferase [Halobacillus salinarum]|uniref:Methyltransferase n=1 Tax=Halobacillus salinarum TaxID=2932257 RepID=A0ABY4EJR0_9BACI|nr:methyltransferase [Halobacillus salinarum]UOQ44308.1 methyltransferase [Halobacillus salinarum]